MIAIICVGTWNICALAAEGEPVIDRSQTTTLREAGNRGAQSSLFLQEQAERRRLKDRKRRLVSTKAYGRPNSEHTPARAAADTLVTGFEATEGFTPGPIDGQAGWLAFAEGDPEGHIDTANPAAGTQHLRISYDPGLPAPTDTGAFSPSLGTLPTGFSTTVVDIRISAAGGADYFVAGQSDSEDSLTWEVNFSFLGTVWIVDDLGSGWALVDTGFPWTAGSYKTLVVCDDPVAGTTQYVYGGVLFYSQVAHLPGTRVEQVVFVSDNFHLDDDGDFDNLSVVSGLFGCALPAVSDWGLAVMMLSVLTAGTLVLGRRRALLPRGSTANPVQVTHAGTMGWGWSANRLE